MADNKVNMSLDDIIKLNKKNKQSTFPKKVAQGGGARAGRGTAKVGRGGIGGQRGAKFAPAGKSGTARAVVNSAGVRKGAVNTQTKKLVNQLVKKALKIRLGNELASRPIAATRGVRVGRGALAARINQGGLLNRVAGRSRVIGKSRPIIARPVVLAQRGRGFRNRANLYQNQVVRPVIVQQAPRLRPVIIERVVQAPRVQRVVQAPRVQRVVQRPNQRIMVQRQPIRERVIQPIRQRVIQRPQSQRFIVVERQPPLRQVQRPQTVRQQRQEAIQYVPARNNARNNSFRNAANYVPARRVETVQRFEPSTSFITRKVVRRGRGFQAM